MGIINSKDLMRYIRASAIFFKLGMLKLNYCSLKLIHSFARALFLMKKFEIVKTKPTFVTSVLKVFKFQLFY